MTTRNCKRCEGTGIRVTAEWTGADGKIYPERQELCRGCKGVGTFEPLDEAAIRAEIFTSRGGKHRLKASLNSYKASGRGYYVWRLARFHGGADVTMPVMAMFQTDCDPFGKELDALADTVAREAFGTHFAAALRWKGLLY